MPEPPLASPGCVWVVTDHRYLAQRMPRALVGWLGAAGVPCRVVAVDGGPVAPGPLGGEVGDHGMAHPAGGDVVVGRTRDPLALTVLAAMERPGVQALPSPTAIQQVRNKARMACILADHGIPTPPTWLASSPADLARLPVSAFPLLCKPHLGDNARGIVMVPGPGELDGVGCSDGIVVAQTFVDVGGLDLKLYGVGEQVWAVRRRSPLLEPGHDDAAVPVEVTPELRDLAGSCREAFGLELFGVDVLEAAEGPLVVEVNEFPNYTGVPEATDAIGRLVVDRLAAVVAA